MQDHRTSGQNIRRVSSPTGSAAKRQRVESALIRTDGENMGGQLSPAGAPYPPNVDVFDFFAARGSETKSLQLQLDISKRNEERLQQHLKEFQEAVLYKEVTTNSRHLCVT